MGSAKSGRLPEGLQEVEYLESTGEQWIDTGLPMSGYYDYEFIFMAINNTAAVLIGIMQYRGDPCNLLMTNSSGLLSLYRQSSLCRSNTLSDWQKYTVQTVGSSMYLNGSPFESSSDTNFAREASLTIFSDYINKGLVRIYKSKIIQNLSTLLDYIPCYTTVPNFINELGNQVPTGTKGMYDLVNNVLYTNRGTGADFIAGPDV